MKLEVHERMALIQLLPKEGTYEGLKSLRKAREILSFTPEESEFYNIRIENGNTVWDGTKAQSRVLDAPLEEYIIDLIRKKLSDLEKQGKLTEPYLSVFEKFVISYMSVFK